VKHVSGERALEDLRTLSSHHRVQASPGYDDAAAWLEGALERNDLQPIVETVPGDGRTRCHGQLMPQGWACVHAHAKLIGRDGREDLADYACDPLSLVLRSDSVSGRFPLVALDDGTEPGHYASVDVSGKMVLTSGAVHRVHTLAVVERGAAGLLADGRRLMPPIRDHHTDADALNYTSFWWNGDEPRGWGFVVSPRRGAELRTRMARGEVLEVEAAIASRRFDTLMPLVSTVLSPEYGPADGEILLVAHLCHPQPSANDNASGAAALLECARVLGEIHRLSGDTWKRSVRFLWVPEITGTCAWRDRHPDITARTRAALNLDMVGQNQEECGSTFLLERAPCFSASFAEPLLRRVRTAASEWVASYSGPGHVPVTRMGEVPYSGGSDHAYLLDPAAGIPCPMLIQWPDRYYHSSSDTPDKSDPKSLALAVRCAATYASALATGGAESLATLTGAVERDARHALLAAFDFEHAPAALAHARIAAHAAFRSLARMGVNPEVIERAHGDFDDFAAREWGTHAPPPTDPAFARQVPRRWIAALPDYQRHLLPGWSGLARDEREAFRRFDQSVAGPAPLLDLAWFACDGQRSIEDIARLVWAETGRWEPETIATWFTWAERLGIGELRGG
jgi:hypothetical protein